MEHEIEAKFLLTDHTVESLRAQLQRIGAVLESQERRMIRSLFGKEKNNLLDSDYLRVRDEGGKVTFSAKKHTSIDGDPHDNKELVVEVSDYATAVKILEQGGLIKTGEQETKRESWLLGDVEIEIDTWPGLDPYVEIEAPDLASLQRTAEALGFDWSKRIVSSVEDIYMDVYEADRETVKRETSFCTFAKPAFGEK